MRLGPSRGLKSLTEFAGAPLVEERADTRCLAEIYKIHNNTGKLYHPRGFDKPETITNIVPAQRREMRVRHATPGDLESIVTIYNSTIPKRVATADTEPVPVESRRAWLTERRENRPVWVAEPEEGVKPGDMAGWIALGEFHPRPAYHATAEVAVYISEDWRGEGVGKLLVREAVRLGPRLGIKSLIAGVFAHNEASLGLFEGLGFSRWAHLPGVAELDGVERDLVYLGLRLC